MNIMPTVQLTHEQMIELVKQLLPERKRVALLLLAETRVQCVVFWPWLAGHTVLWP